MQRCPKAILLSKATEEQTHHSMGAKGSGLHRFRDRTHRVALQALAHFITRPDVAC